MVFWLRECRTQNRYWRFWHTFTGNSQCIPALTGDYGEHNRESKGRVSATVRKQGFDYIRLASLNSEFDSVRKALATATEQITDKQSLLDEYRTRLEKTEKDIAEQKTEFEKQINMLKQEHRVDKQSAVLEEKSKQLKKLRTWMTNFKQTRKQ